MTTNYSIHDGILVIHDSIVYALPDLDSSFVRIKNSTQYQVH
jgi:hypothetical protein